MFSNYFNILRHFIWGKSLEKDTCLCGFHSVFGDTYLIRLELLQVYVQHWFFFLSVFFCV